METPSEVTAEMFRRNEQVRQVAQRFIREEATAQDGPAYGDALLLLVEQIDGLRDGLTVIEQQREVIEQQREAIDLLEALIDRQAAALDGLVVENEDLRAKLYLQDRQTARPAPREAPPRLFD